MSRLATLCLSAVIGLAVALTGCVPNPDWNEAVHASELDRASLTYQWKNVIPLSRFEKIVSVSQMDENLYCLSNTNTVYAFNATNGTLRWSVAVAARGVDVLGMAHADRVMLPAVLGTRNITSGQVGQLRPVDLLVVTNLQEAVMMDRASGEILQRIAFSRAGFMGNTAPACDAERIFVGGLRGWCHAIEYVSGVEVWKAYTQGALSAAPAVMGQSLFVADDTGTVYSLRIGKHEHERNWPYGDLVPQTEGAISADMAVTGEAVYVGSGDYSVYAFEPTSGRKLWRFRCGGPIETAVLAGRTNVYAYASRDALYALDRAGRDEAKWVMPAGRMVLTEIGDSVYVLDDRNYVVAADTETGRAKISVPMTGLNVFTANVEAQAIFAASDDGLVCRIDPK